MELKVENLSFSYGKKNTLDNISLQVNQGELVGLIGPNGSGKSTLLKILYRSLRTGKGKALLNGRNLFSMSIRESAALLGVVGQELSTPFDFTVEEMVEMGRTPHKSWYQKYTPLDKEITAQALDYFQLQDLAQHNYQQLSGGEKQRVLLARVLAQQASFLILDEPTNFLDIGFQLHIFNFIRQLPCSVLAAVHDLNLAAIYCDRIYALKDGKIYGEGTPAQILTSETIYDLYGVKALVENKPETGLSISYLPDQARRYKHETAQQACSFGHGRSISHVHVV